MAASTGIVLTGGAIALTDLILTDWNTTSAVRISVAATLAALASAGLDKAIPGLGTGLASLYCLTVVLTSGPRVLKSMGLTS